MTFFRLQVLCPLNSGQVFLGPESSKAFVKSLERNGWKKSDSHAALDFSQEFCLEHASFRKDITRLVQDSLTFECNGSSPDLESCELHAFKTGIVLMCSTH